MEIIKYLIDLTLHLDRHLGEIIAQYGTWTYLILFTIIFCETGLVVTPFLPGDSLLFAAGTFCADRTVDGTVTPAPLNVWWLFILLSIAAIIGDTVNYWVGAWIGPKAFSGEYRWLKKEYLERTHRFYEKHGGKAIILARFVPIIRTFAPFVAGIGAMNYTRFIAFNVIGGIAWVGLFTFLGWQFSQFPFVQKNFFYVILVIIGLSVLPIVFEYWRARAEARRQAAVDAE